MVQGIESDEPGADSAGDLKQRLLAEQVRLLFRSPVALIVNVVNGAIVAAVLWPAVDRFWVALWAVALAATIALRLLLRRSYAASVPDKARHWGRLYAAGAAATGLLWGLLAVVVVVVPSPTYHMFVGLTVAGMAAGAAAALAFHLPSFFAFILPSLVPISAAFLVQGELPYIGLGAMGVVFIAALTGLARSFNGALTETLRLRFLNTDMARDLTQAQAMAEAARGSSADILAHLSHELRTPLNAIAGFAEIMRNRLFGPLGDSKYNDYVKDIADSAHHLIKVVDEILRFSKVHTGKLVLDEGVVDPRTELESCLSMVSGPARDAGVTLTREIPPHLPALRADAVKLRQILVNLLSNAIKFTPAGGLVTARVTLEAGAMTFVIADTGIGMKPEDVPRVLLPYVQVENVLTRTRTGLGLGLPLAKRLTELHGGTLSIQSAVGAGTAVSVCLPASRTIDRDSGSAEATHIA
jgi:two-component system cell cycle sensor histidine kinase PleC